MVSILWIYVPQMWAKKWFGRTKNATFSKKFLYLNIYSTLFTTINDDISIYIYVNETKIPDIYGNVTRGLMHTGYIRNK